MENETEENMQDEMQTSVSYIEVLGIIICIMSLGFLYDSAVKNNLVLTSHPTKPALHFYRKCSRGVPDGYDGSALTGGLPSAYMCWRGNSSSGTVLESCLRLRQAQARDHMVLSS